MGDGNITEGVECHRVAEDDRAHKVLIRHAEHPATAPKQRVARGVDFAPFVAILVRDLVQPPRSRKPADAECPRFAEG
eukprot:1187553-Prymnesium_polylepis.2